MTRGELLSIANQISDFINKILHVDSKTYITSIPELYRMINKTTHARYSETCKICDESEAMMFVDMSPSRGFTPRMRFNSVGGFNITIMCRDIECMSVCSIFGVDFMSLEAHRIIALLWLYTIKNGDFVILSNDDKQKFRGMLDFSYIAKVIYMMHDVELLDKVLMTLYDDRKDEIMRMIFVSSSYECESVEFTALLLNRCNALGIDLQNNISRL